MRDHSRIEELISVRALGGLDPEDEAALERELAEHGPECAECRRLEREYGEAAGRLAFALDPAPVREGLEEEVVARALRPPAGAPDRPLPWRRGLGAVAAAAVLFAGGWLLRDLTAREIPAPADFIRDARLVAFQGTGGQLTMAYRPGRPGAYVFGTGLQAPPTGKVYELWMIEGSTPVRGACFTPRGEGGRVLTYIDASLAAVDAMAVTLEPNTCPTAPTTEPILTAELS